MELAVGREIHNRAPTSHNQKDRITMCVTTAQAQIDRTQVYSLVTTHIDGGQPVHVTGYQNRAKNLSAEPNCMILHFPSQAVPELLQGATSSKGLMASITAGLDTLGPTPPVFRGRGSHLESAHVEEYGDYHVVLADYAKNMLNVLDQVPTNRRPRITPQLEALVGWYGQQFPDYTFLLACFDGSVHPSHPIVVSYVPDNDDVIFCPGLDGHDGTVPELGAPIDRDFKVAYGVAGLTLKHEVNFGRSDWWIPTSIAGFHDNRASAPNGDYVIPLMTLQERFDGRELAEDLIM